MATTAKGSGGSQIGTLRISKGLRTAATTAAIATPQKDSKGQIWLPAPGYAPQNQEQEKTGYLQQCCHD